MIDLMEADRSALRYRNAYNVTAMSITPAELAAEIRKHLPWVRRRLSRRSDASGDRQFLAAIA